VTQIVERFAGNNVLRFVGTSENGPGGRTSDILQYVDLALYSQHVATGQLEAILTSSFFRIDPDDQTDDNEFAVVLAAHAGTPENSPGQLASLAYEVASVNTPNSAVDTVSVLLSVPSDADFLQATLAAIENVFDDLEGVELEAHYADDASLRLYLRGDFTHAGSVTVKDIDLLSSETANPFIEVPDRLRMDLNRDGVLDLLDHQVLVEDVMHATYGDANPDGEFNSGHLVAVLASGTYEMDVDSVWSTGDFNGDARTNSSDLVVALAGGGYEAGPLAATAAAVPEPSGLVLGLLGLVAMVGYGRQK
jgi:hypothetical protein